MAAIDELLNLITDENLRTRLSAEIVRLKENTQFGLVWEKHLPENAQLTGFKIRVGSTVAVRGESTKDSKTMTVLSIDKKKGKALCRFETKYLKGNAETKEQVFAIADLVVVARCGEPIFPTLRPIDKVENAPYSSLWHTLIQADNYHALQLLAYLYPGQVDCIYIDPPYNTGARDWKYNNDYVDSNDKYRHSKWLSMMESRLQIAKRLLNPAKSVLIVTIDEKEYLHLGCLLEQMFPEARIQMVSIVIQAAGQNRKNELGRVNEYAFFLSFGDFTPFNHTDDLLNEAPSTKTDKVRWESLLRGGTGSERKDSPNLFYPIYIDKSTGHIVGCGESKDVSASLSDWTIPEGCEAIWPFKTGNIQGRWRATQSTLLDWVQNGWAKAGKITAPGKGTVWYAGKSVREKVAKGEFRITGKDEQGAYVIEVVDAAQKTFPAKTVWNRARHHAGWYGSNLLTSIINRNAFAFPKSIYAVLDALRIATGNKPNALIVDFFAGSGTTLHAVNLLNAEDGGHRRCIMVTNNEVGETEAKEMRKHGHKPGDKEWESRGIAQYVTWPRTVCSIKGVDVNDQPIKGAYLGSDRPMSEGFESNCEFFKLEFLDKTEIAFGLAFREILPLLWLKAGAKGVRPEISVDAEIPTMLVKPENNFAVLTDEDYFPAFVEQLAQCPTIEYVFIVTDSNKGFQEMARELSDRTTYQLYRDYLDNFRINIKDNNSK